MPGKFLFQNFNHLGTVLSLPLGLFGVEAQDIAFAHLAVADDHLFGVQVVFNSIYRDYEMIFTLALRSRFAYSNRFLD
jgi:hypothetical protein